MEETRANFQNQGTSIKNLEVQVGQITQQLSKSTQILPSDTILNPRKECKTIYLRSEKVVGEEAKKEAIDRLEKEAQ
ncbi:hypothetical protein AHAS_Ahas13G0317600 [Arachis hypogaea]